jgi:hypothetical protein
MLIFGVWEWTLDIPQTLVWVPLILFAWISYRTRQVRRAWLSGEGTALVAEVFAPFNIQARMEDKNCGDRKARRGYIRLTVQQPQQQAQQQNWSAPPATTTVFNGYQPQQQQQQGPPPSYAEAKPVQWQNQ